jgi:chromosome segregation ATPase
MSDTPETDKSLLWLSCDDSCCRIYVQDSNENDVDCDIVSADFARRLERERDDARKENAEMRSTLEAIHDAIFTGKVVLTDRLKAALDERDTIRKELAELKETNDHLRRDLASEKYARETDVQAIERERDEARALLRDALEELHGLKGERDWWKDEPRNGYQERYNKLCELIERIEKLP